MRQLIHIPEPHLLFANEQRCIDPRDGLAMFGPVNRIYGIKSGVVATKEGLNIFKAFLEGLQKPTFNANNLTRPMFPGFEAVFNCKWEPEHIFFQEVTRDEIAERLYNENTHKRTYDLVSLFLTKIVDAEKNADENVDVWFVVVPDEIYKYCRPNQTLPKELVQTKRLISKVEAKTFHFVPSLFSEIDEDNQAKEEEAVAYNYDAQFHDQLKARLLSHTIPTQIVRESTLAWREFKNKFGAPLRDFSKIEGHLAWTLSTGVFYKSGGKPWKLSDIRSGVCYLGLVYGKFDKLIDAGFRTKNRRSSSALLNFPAASIPA